MERIRRALPERYIGCLSVYGDTIDEIRLRRGARVTLTQGKRNIITDIITENREMDEIIAALCENSLYSYDECIRQGYIPGGDGIRIGVAGRAVSHNGKLLSVAEIRSLNIRIARPLRGVSGFLYNYLKKHDFRTSVLIYSPPGEGKTTLLRDLVMRLSVPPTSRRVALIDSREEMYISDMEACPLLDVFSGYPGGTAIEYALRTMSPQIIVCDELCNTGDITAVLENQATGIPLIASAHGDSAESLVLKDGISILHAREVFDAYVGISRRGDSKDYDYEITERDDLNNGQIYGNAVDTRRILRCGGTD